MVGRSTSRSRSVPPRSQARCAAGVVKAVAGRAAAGRRHDPAIGVEPDGPDRQPGSPGEVADRVEPVAVHAPTLASPPTGGSSSFSLPARALLVKGPGLSASPGFPGNVIAAGQ